ncbi:MAG: DUF5131 family protein [Clostridia bacterium]|nr:DUF5131 family protein [Clostridia bacterium]
MEQLSLFPRQENTQRPPQTVTWNLWHGCTKVSSGCMNCYMYRRDEQTGKDPAVVQKTAAFDLPVRTLRSGPYRGEYKIPSGSLIYTCFSSDFFHRDADVWREKAWEMMKNRSDCGFFMITKRPERIKDCLPSNWETDYSHVTIAVTCEDQKAADMRLPVYLSLPLHRFSVMVEPMLSEVDLSRYFSEYRFEDGRPLIGGVSVGGESGPNARACDFSWVLGLHSQCEKNAVKFSYHQTGARLIKDGKEYNIPRSRQHEQAKRAGLDLK